MSVFSRVAKRGHFPRERAIRRIFTGADIPLPTNPRHLPKETEIAYITWCKLYRTPTQLIPGDPREPLGNDTDMEDAEGEEESESIEDSRLHL